MDRRVLFLCLAAFFYLSESSDVQEYHVDPIDYNDLPGPPYIEEARRPSLPSLSKLIAKPKMPSMPKLPSLPSLPKMPSLPKLSLPKIPSLPKPSLPEMPSLPSLPKFNWRQLRDLNISEALETALNFMTDRQDADRHFDSTSFCFKSVVGDNNNSSIKEQMSQQRFFMSTLLIMKCVALTDAAVLPYNIYQDFKNAVTDFRRGDSSWSAIIEQFFKLPFIIARTVMLQPARTISRLSAVVFGSVITYADVYG